MSICLKINEAVPKDNNIGSLRQMNTLWFYFSNSRQVFDASSYFSSKERYEVHVDG